MQHPSHEGKSAVAPERVGDNPDKVHDGQTLVGCGEEDGADGDERAVVEGNDARDALRGAKAGGVAVVVAAGVGVVFGGDEATVAVAVVVAAAAVELAVAVAYASQAPPKGSFEGGQPRS